MTEQLRFHLNAMWFGGPNHNIELIFGSYDTLEKCVAEARRIGRFDDHMRWLVGVVPFENSAQTVFYNIVRPRGDVSQQWVGLDDCDLLVYHPFSDMVLYRSSDPEWTPNIDNRPLTWADYKELTK